MKFGQLIEYNRNIFLQKSHTENEAGRLVMTSFFCNKGLYKVKANGLHLGCTIFRLP